MNHQIFSSVTGERCELAGVWSLAPADGSVAAIPATMPGDQFTALMQAEIIPDPYLQCHENLVQQVALTDWALEREFTVSAAMLAKESVFLNFDSVDTFAEIRINDQPVATTQNMFRRVRCEVKPLLKLGSNRIRVVIMSPVRAAELADGKLVKHFPQNPNNRYPYFNLIRKAQCHAGWDWGICLPTSGLYGELYLQAADGGRIESVRHRQFHASNEVRVEVIVELFAQKSGETELAVELNGECQKQRVGLYWGENQISFFFVIRNPDLWYPAGCGEQPLYPLRVATPDQCLSRKLGIRQLEVIHEPDEHGWSMGFKVNGIDIFAKGANWIPVDAMPGRFPAGGYRRLLEAAKTVNMNMIRVWGGGIYETDEFYDLCDELGLLVWQDLMFACAQYPSIPEFLAQVREELSHQIRRLQSHASLALWCGDNEVFMCLGTTGDMMEYADRRVNFDRLNRTLAEMTAIYDPDRMFWPSSPCNGPQNMHQSCHDMTRGDMHYWQVWHGGDPFSAYCKIKPRFCSEFGYQSFPSLQTVKRYTQERGINVTSPVMEHHQRHGGGNSRIVEMFTRYFRFPAGDEAVIYLSQLQQALAIKTAVEFWRTLKPYCRGTLYWQFNDNWPVASWAGIDYYGEWKQLQYHAKRFYAPLLVTAFRTPEGVPELHVVSDLNTVFDGEIKATFMDFKGQSQLQLCWDVRLDPQQAKKIAELPDLDATAGFYVLELDGHGYRQLNEFFLTEFKRCELPHASIRSSFYRDDDRLMLALETDLPAFYVVCEFTDAHAVWSDNSILLLPGRKTVLECQSELSLTLAEATKQLRITQLRDTYQ